MSKLIKIGFMLFSITIICSGFAYADGQDRDQKRNRDGSCQTELVTMDAGLTLAADQDRNRDRDKDGSCQTDAVLSYRKA